MNILSKKLYKSLCREKMKDQEDKKNFLPSAKNIPKLLITLTVNININANYVQSLKNLRSYIAE